MKLQPASRKEVRRMAIGCGVCTVIELAAFFLLHLLGIVYFSYRVVLGALCGCGVAILNFTFLCLTIQKATTIEDPKQMKARVQFSYNIRLALQAAWVVIAFLVPIFNVLAAAAPLLFPTMVIFFLQSRGKLVEPSERKNPEPSDDDEEEDRLESFEA